MIRMIPRDQLFFFGTKRTFRCTELSFVGHIKQTIYVFVYEKINQNKVISGTTNIRSVKYFGSEIAGLLESFLS